MRKQKIILSILLITTGIAFAAPKSNVVKDKDGTLTIPKVDADAKSTKFNQRFDGFKDVTVVTGKNVTKQNPITIDLSEFSNKEIVISISGDLMVKDSSSDENEITWMINDYDAGFPELFRAHVKNNEWTHFSGEVIVALGEKKQLYLSSSGLSLKDIVFYLKDLQIKIQTEDTISNEKISWLDAPKLKDVYKDIFDIGIAIEYRGELAKKDIQKGLSLHANSITLGNEFKPDFLFNWQTPNGKLEDFVAEDGKTYKVPANLPKFSTFDTILKTAKENGLKVRGHVLVWHAQTPAWFFKKDYSTDEKAEYTDRATMSARQEWYIKKVLEHVKEWEEKNNCTEHVVYCWDVVNEACADNSTDTRWLREDSNWYRIYKDETFIVNAFRYANKYAPSDVLLAYNDYGCYSGSNKEKGGKTNAVLKVIDAIQAAPDARLDVLGMQSHIGVDSPKVSGDDSYETAVQKFIAKNIDVQVTELDIGNGDKRYSPIRLKARYRDMYEMFIRNRKTEDKHGISVVTVWGLIDEKTWLNGPDKPKQYPLLFETNDVICKPCFFGVVEAAEKFKASQSSSE